jgi:protein phosphatase
MVMRLRAVGASDPGRVRRKDEDAFLVREDLGLFAVADGVGGNRAGEIASRIAVEMLASEIKDAVIDTGVAGPLLGRTALEQAFRSIHDVIRREGMSHPRYRGMATTLVTLFAPGSDSWVAHSGDSRAYLLRRGELSPLTEDHSAMRELALAVPESDRRAFDRSPFAHVLTRCLGMDGSAGPDVRPLRLEEGDRVLLCCDGVTDMLPKDRIERRLATTNSLEECCRGLIREANEAGGEDNITVVVADVATSA